MSKKTYDIGQYFPFWGSLNEALVLWLWFSISLEPGAASAQWVQ